MFYPKSHNIGQPMVLCFFSIPGSAKKKCRISCGTAVIRAQNNSKKVTTDWGDRKFLALLPNFTSNFL